MDGVGARPDPLTGHSIRRNGIDRPSRSHTFTVRKTQPAIRRTDMHTIYASLLFLNRAGLTAAFFLCTSYSLAFCHLYFFFVYIPDCVLFSLRLDTLFSFVFLFLLPSPSFSSPLCKEKKLCNHSHTHWCCFPASMVCCSRGLR